jgi:protease-4
MNPKFKISPLLGMLLVLFTQSCIVIQPFGSGARRGTMNIEIIRKADRLFTRDHILVIPVTGVVNQRGSSGFIKSKGMLVELKDRLMRAELDPNLKGVVLKIESPGGSVTASDLIHREIMQFKKKKNVPVVAMMGNVAASGGVYIAMAADRIHALPTTLTGSIGVIMTLPQMEKLSRKIGFDVAVVKSGSNKDAGSPFRDLTSEQRALFQEIIDQYYVQFTDIILESREGKGLTREILAEIADGRVFLPQIALEYHLIDGIKYPDEIYTEVKNLAQIDDAHIVTYEYPFSYRGHYHASAPMETPVAHPPDRGDINLLKLDMNSWQNQLGGAEFMYLWIP